MNEYSKDVAVSLADTLAKASAAGERIVSKLYGDGASVAAVKLALRAAHVLDGTSKAPTSGGNATTTNAVVREVRDAGTYDEAALMAAAVHVLAVKAEAERVRREAAKADRDALAADRAAAKAVLNDRGRSKADRIQALDLMSEIDGMGAAAKADAKRATFTRALESFRDAGFTREQALAILDEVFPVVAPLAVVA
jgi:hypothetical protein